MSKNDEMLRQLKQDIAEHIKSEIVKVAKEKDLESHIPDKKTFIDSIEVSIGEDGKLFVGTELVYALAIEDGRLAGHHVPIKPLVDWLHYKKHLPIEQAKHVAYALERKIYNDGIVPKKPFKVALTRISSGVSV